MKSSPAFRSLALSTLTSFAVAVLLAPGALAAPMSFVITTASGSGTVVVDPDLAVVTDVAADRSEGAVLDFEFTSDFAPFFNPGALDVNATITLADFDSPADIPDAVFFGGVFAGLDRAAGNATIPGFDVAVSLDAVAVSLATINPAAAGELNIILDDGTDFWDDCCSYSFAPAPNGPGPGIPEPTAALVFAAGFGVVAMVQRRKR